MASSKRDKLTPIQRSRAFQRLEKVKKWLEQINYRLDELVTLHGFKKIHHNGVSKIIYVNYQLKVVVKTPFTIYKKIPKYAVPTIIVPRKVTGLYRNIFIQPLAKVKDICKRQNVFKFLMRCHRSNDVPDRHSGNVGYYCQIPCWIDW